MRGLSSKGASVRGVVALLLLVGGLARAQRPMVPGGAAAEEDHGDDVDDIAASVDEEPYLPNRTRDFNAFEWRLCGMVNKLALDDTNALVSPVGARILLALLGEAARGEAAQELRDALQMPPCPGSARHFYRRLLAALKQRGDGYTVEVGNRVFLDKNYKPNSKVARTYNNMYDASIDKVDFNQPARVRSEINSWVSHFTQGHISRLFTDDKQLQDTIALFINIIYFKGKWIYPFSKKSTMKSYFYKTPEQKVKVDYMRQKGNFYFLESKTFDAKVLRLPYQGNKYSAFILLPNNAENFDTMLRSLDPVLIREQLLLMKKAEIDIMLPRMKFACTLQLKDILQAIGIRRIFDVKDELVLTENKTQNLISEVFQKIAIEIDEEGTVASSASGSGLTNTFGGYREFKATHPFMYFVEEEKTGTVLFVGKVVDPSLTHCALGPVLNRSRRAVVPVGSAGSPWFPSSNEDSSEDSQDIEDEFRDPARTFPGVPQRSPE